MSASEFHRPPIQTDAAMAPAVTTDAAGRLEPLAVPFGRLWSVMRRHLWVVLLIPLVGIGVTTVLLKQLPKQYTAEASIVIEPQRTQVSDLQAISPDAGDAGSLVRTQIDILRSPALTRSVVQALNLTVTAEFAPLTGGLTSQFDWFLERTGLRTATATATATQDDRVQTAAEILDTKIGFANEARSNVLRITVTTHSPKLSADIANKVVQQYLDFKRQEKFTAMQRAHDWFKEQMGSLSEQLRVDGLAVEKYRQEHRLDEQPPDDGAPARSVTVSRQQLDAISGQLAEVSRERAQKEGQLAEAQAVIHGQVLGAALPEVLASPVITQLLSQMATIAGREAELSTVQGGGNPELVAARAQLHRLQARTEAEMTNIANSLAGAVNASRVQERVLRDQAEQLRRAVGAENVAQVALQALLTKARATRSIYESFLSRATQLANVAGIQEPDASLVSSARPPLAPSGPKIMRLVAVVGVLSLAVGIGLACLTERLCAGFSRPEQLEATLGLQLMAMMPTVPRKALSRPCGGKAARSFNASLDNLRGTMRAFGEGRPKLVMITSALPKEGKSVFAAAFARNAASAGWRVMLIECDVCCPALANQFGIADGPGLCEILSGNVLGDLQSVVHGLGPRLHVITSGRTTSDPQELLASATMGALLDAVRTRYDLVLLDTPPVLPVADALVLARQADATVLVVRWEKTDRVAVQDALRRLRESRARIVGAVMTRVDLRAAAGAGGRMAYALGRYNTYQFARHSRLMRPS